MSRELKALIFSMSYNFIITIIKIFGGIFFGLGSLFADGLHTLSDFITDLISFLGVNVSKKRPTKSHPFGFGRVEYLTNLFVGMLLIVLAIYIIISGFLVEFSIPDITVFYLIITVFFLKLIVVVFLRVMSKKVRSQVIITSYREAILDLISTIIVFVVTILLQYSLEYSILEYADMIGSSIIGLMVFVMALKIISENALSLLGEAEVDNKLCDDILEYVLSFYGVHDAKFNLIKYGDYYQIHLMIEVTPGLKLKQISNLERKIKVGLNRHHKFHIKYSTIYVTNQLDK